MSIDPVRLSAAIDAAIPLLEAAAHDEHAHVLRTQAPALFRFARLGQAAHDAHGREPQPSTDVHPKTEPITRNPAAPTT